jgi:hypothetical protein
MSRRLPKVGIIAEDDSDVDSVRVLIHRLVQNEHIGIKRRVGNGCGKINRKCRAWSEDLKRRGCSLLILVHDLDSEQLNDLIGQITQALDPCPIGRHLICIPVQEFEAWLLSDPAAIRSSMNLNRTPNVAAPPETINHPKEYLGELILRSSDGEKIYINTRHNPKIAAALSITRVLGRCPSFVPFHDFVLANLS